MEVRAAQSEVYFENFFIRCLRATQTENVSAGFRCNIGANMLKLNSKVRFQPRGSCVVSDCECCRPEKPTKIYLIEMQRVV